MPQSTSQSKLRVYAWVVFESLVWLSVFVIGLAGWRRIGLDKKAEGDWLLVAFGVLILYMMSRRTIPMLINQWRNMRQQIERAKALAKEPKQDV